MAAVTQDTHIIQRGIGSVQSSLLSERSAIYRASAQRWVGRAAPSWPAACFGHCARALAKASIKWLGALNWLKFAEYAATATGWSVIDREASKEKKRGRKATTSASLNRPSWEGWSQPHRQHMFP